MWLPAPDEAPLAYCPWCGQEFHLRTDDPEDHFEQISQSVYRHKKKECGGLVVMRGVWE